MCYLRQYSRPLKLFDWEVLFVSAPLQYSSSVYKATTCGNVLFFLILTTSNQAKSQQRHIFFLGAKSTTTISSYSIQPAKEDENYHTLPNHTARNQKQKQHGLLRKLLKRKRKSLKKSISELNIVLPDKLSYVRCG